MPYINPAERDQIDLGDGPGIGDIGTLNYRITTLVDDWLCGTGVNYRALNSAIGVLECAKLELYRRIAAPYEDNALERNGDVYECVLPDS